MRAPAAIELDGQYRALRERVGLLVRSDRTWLVVRGRDGAEYLQGQLTNDVEALSPGEGCYAALLDRKGRIRADLTVLRLAAQELWLEAEAIAAEAVRRHLDTYRIGREVEVAVAADVAVVSLIGPAAAEIAGSPPLAEHAHREIDVAGTSCRAVGTYAGIQLLVPAPATERVVGVLLSTGAVEVGEEAAEIVRVESGRPRYGREMSDAHMPAEAGIVDRAVSFSKGCYIGQEPVARLHYKGRPNRHLRGLRLERPAASGEAIRLGEREVGRVGTACISPALGPLALAVLRREAEPGSGVAVGETGNIGQVVELPF